MTLAINCDNTDCIGGEFGKTGQFGVLLAVLKDAVGWALTKKGGRGAIERGLAF